MAIGDSVGQWLENAGAVNNARDYRRLLDQMMMGWDVRTAGGSATEGTANGGVTRSGAMAVSQRASGGAGMAVDVAAGGCIVGGTESATQGDYFVYNDAVVTLTISAADPTNPRIDIVGVRVRDSEYSGAIDDTALVVVTGTAAAVPAEPTLPENFLTLARVDVPAADTSITNGQITDRRRRVAALGGITVCTSSTRPTVGLWEGLFIYETDTDRVLFYNGSGWSRIGDQGTPPGMVVASVLTSAPTDWALIYGQTITSAQTSYATLWNDLDTAFKSGSSFVTPDARGRTIVGKDNMGGSTASRVTNATSGITGTTMGAAGGNQAIATHTHTFNMYAGFQNAIAPGRSPDTNLSGNPSGTDTSNGPNITNASGHGNMQPSVVLNLMVKLQ